ncbi:hypothetical protein E2562_014558 [Oryza meyeriana var. granulata]|uniref:Uncharacterized protein n=1 Tax=Oryza meyeriana var. granulata TaxID=110450 RepID=A0A6G1EJ34_9ORYZ|nr:hypothetical protein E2562_014558 [Oryza meyeriana var. granulata]KAF0924758.1 hypothetical protein E2562_014558 [Oryza meyeriana var. granulata]KAF0924759.1 hypothetical protein E2562_014558 [Oryza meyeriana var. granulata]
MANCGGTSDGKNRVNFDFKVHRGGSNSITTVCQKLSEKEGRKVTEIEGWVYTHRGPDPNNPDVLNTDRATECLKSYKKNVQKRKGKEYNWKQSAVWCQKLYTTQVVGSLMESGLCAMGQFKTRKLSQRQEQIAVLRSLSVHSKNKRNI